MTDKVALIASIVAAVAGVGSWIATGRNSKASILRRIDKKERRIRKIDDQLAREFGINGRPNVILPIDEKRRKLISEVEYLKRLL